MAICTQDKVCLVVLDHAGLSTNREDVEQFVNDNDNLRMIIVDMYSAKFYKRQKVSDEPQTLKAFECRSRPLQRSK